MFMVFKHDHVLVEKPLCQFPSYFYLASLIHEGTPSSPPPLTSPSVAIPFTTVSKQMGYLDLFRRIILYKEYQNILVARYMG